MGRIIGAVCAYKNVNADVNAAKLFSENNLKTFVSGIELVCGSIRQSTLWFGLWAVTYASGTH